MRGRTEEPSAASTIGFGHHKRVFLACALIALSACSELAEQFGEAADDQAPARETAAAEAPDGVVLEAEQALARRDYGRAYDLLRPYIILNPESDAAKFALAGAYLGRGEPRNAETVLSVLSDEAKETARAYQLRGLAMLAQSRPAEAAEQLEIALEKEPDRWRAANGLGLIHDFERRWDAAQASYRKALAAKSDAAIVYNNLGFSYLLQGRVDEAIEAFSTGLSHEPELVTARANLRLALAAKGRYVDAAAGVAKRDLPQVLNNIGYVAMLRGDYPAAEAFFSRAIEESPFYYDAAVENLERLEALRDAPPSAGTGGKVVF